MATASFNCTISTTTGGGAFPGTTTQGVNDVSFNLSRNLIDVSQMDGASGFVKRLAALKDFPVTISGFFLPNDTSYGHMKANFVSGTQLGVQIDFSGGDKLSLADALVESIDISASVDGAQEVSITIQSNSNVVIT